MARKKKKTKDDKKAKFALLVPFIPAMKKMLKKKGVGYGKSTESVATAFYNTFLKGKGNYENLDPVTVSVIVSSIASFFKALKRKRDSGEPLSKTEEDILNLSEQAAQNVKSLAKDEAEEGIGEFITSPLFFILLAVAFLMFRRE